MSEFFLSWQLWEQMTFCLGCAMVMVVAAAMCRNAWDWWNLRKHVRLLKERQAEEAKLLQAHPSVRKRRLDKQVPFGVRAIQSGIEVDGVWISRPNSTVNSPSTTTPASPMALEPVRFVGNIQAATQRTDEDSRNRLAAAARQLEMQTSGGRMIPPRAAHDPFRDSAAPSDRSARSDKSDTQSQYHHRSATESSAYRDMPDEEAGLVASGASSSRMRSSRRHSQVGLAEHVHQPDYFSMSTNHPQAYVPSRRGEQRRSTQNSYIPTEAARRPDHHRARSSFGYSYPQGYTQAHMLPDNSATSPVEMDAGDGLGSGSITPQPRPNQNPLMRQGHRNSSYHMVFSNQAGDQYTQSSGPSHAGNRGATPSPPQIVVDQFATPGAMDRPRRSSHHALMDQMIDEPSPTPGPRDRAEAEADASNMRRVNDGFSVARQGQRRDQESLTAEAEAQAAQADAAKEAESKRRRKLQKKEQRSGVPSEQRPSQFKENI